MAEPAREIVKAATAVSAGRLPAARQGHYGLSEGWHRFCIIYTAELQSKPADIFYKGDET
jgi:hypothetical protein